MLPPPRTLAVLAAVSGIALPSCGGDGEAVTIYSGRTDDLIQPILDDFEEETGIDVEVKYGQSADLALLIEEEVAAGKSDVDVFLSQSPGSVGYLDALGVLADLPADVLALVPAEVADDDGRWVGFSGRQRVLVYNTDLVDEADLPEAVSELVDPSWSGRVGLAPTNGSFQDFVTAMRVTTGDDATQAWLEGIAANDPVAYENNLAVVAGVARGEVEVGLVNHYYNHRALAEDPNQPTANHQLANDDPGSLLIVTAASIIEGTDQPEAAAQLIEFLLGEEGQHYFAAETFEYPLALGTEPPGNLPPLDFQDVSGIDFDELGGGLSGTREMIADAGLEG
jgi:iron(III) transport system substrate-binding protein